ncbi:MAG: ferredoxin [Ferruginibacter sp.]
MPKIIHYRHKCIGCGICYEKQPQHWRMSKKDGKATLLKAIEKKGIYILNIHGAESELSKEIAADCPVNIIKVS